MRKVPTPVLFQLVSTNASENSLPLPVELGPLPLYLDEDGFYSVLGAPLSHVISEDQAGRYALAHNPVNIPVTRTLPRDRVFCQSSKCGGNRFALSSRVALFFTLTNLEKRPAHLRHSRFFL